MRTVVAKFLGGPKDGLFLHVSPEAFYINFPVYTAPQVRFIYDWEPVDPYPNIQMATYRLHSHDPYNPELAYFAYAGMNK